MQGQFSSRVQLILNSEFSFSESGCFTKAKETSLSNYLSKAGRKEDEFMFIPKALARKETQTASSRV